MKRHFKTPGRTLLASLLAGLVLLLDAMAACPSLHEWFHPDSGSPDHQCAVTLFAHGQVESAVTHVAVPAPLIFVESVPVVVLSVFSSTVEQLPAGRAPPVPSSVS